MNSNTPTRTRGRPKKYNTEKERKDAIRKSQQIYFDKVWRCEICNKNLKMASKYNHILSILHRRNSNEENVDTKNTKNAIKVENPDTGRMISNTGTVFKSLIKKYFYNRKSNKFKTKIFDPKLKTKIKLNSKKFQGRLDSGYIYDKETNKLIKPSKKADSAFKNEKLEYDLTIYNISDVKLQVSKLDTRIKFLCKRKLLQNKQSIKINIGMDILFSKTNSDGNIVTNKISLKSNASTINNDNEINKGVNSANEQLFRRIDRFTNNGSGWTVEEINRHYLDIVDHSPLAGNSYIALPSWIQNKKATINIKNKDNKCFIYCLARVLDPNPEIKNLERVSNHLLSVCEQLKLNKIKVPVSMKDIPKIESEYNISINVYSYIDQEKFTVIRTTEAKYEKHVDLLYISDDKTEHYVWIKNFNRLLLRINKCDHKKFFCKHCLQHFTRQDILDNHLKNCFVINGSQAIEMPIKGSKIKFKNLKNSIACPFVIYADLEAILEPIKQTNSVEDNSPYTIKTQKHNPCAFGYKIVCRDNNKYSKPYKSYTGENAIKTFFENLFEDEKYIIDCMNKFKKSDIIMTQKQRQEYNNAKKCYLCGGKFTDDNKKVRDHNHVSGFYRGAAHDKCNLEFKVSNRIPILFHNLKGYDSHHLIKHLGQFNKEIKVIPNNMEKYVSFSLGTERKEWDKRSRNFETKIRHNLTFIDSFQFMSSSLSKLANNLKQNGIEKFKYTSEAFKDNLDYVTRKGIFPYSYLSNFEKMDKNPKLLKSKHFTNDLTGEEISEEDYKFFLDICDKFNIKTLREYLELYLRVDVLILCDVFENFREVCLNYYELDPAHYYTAPGLSWDACLKMTEIELELFTDIDMHLFIEKGLRGGISIAVNRMSKANNIHLTNYDKNEEKKYISYFDANNLYGWGMSQNMPYNGFKWITPKNYILPSYKKLCANTLEKGHILEVDLEYPSELHDPHNELPYCPEQVKITNDMISDYSRKIAEKQNLKIGNYTKLVPTLCNKEKYVIHERNLRQAVDAGLKITKVHRILKFNQKPWIKKYIDFNTQKRKEAKNEFEKDFFKLLNNSFFGKTMEDKRKRVNIKLITTHKMLKKYVSKPTYIGSKIFDENLIAIHNMQDKIILDKPIYLGFSILDISKTLMYDFFYKFIKEKYPGNKSLLNYSDTDSFICTIKTNNIYKDLYKNKELFDLSEIEDEKLMKYKYNDNKKVIGKMKMEYINNPISEFVGLRSKMYSVLFDNNEESKRAKGIVNCVTKYNIKHDMYRETLQNRNMMYSKMNVIRSEKHQLYTMTMNKVSLSCYDDKRYILNDGINSYAYGHYKISK